MPSRMGEGLIKVRIINATDEENARRGLMTADQVRSVEAMALVDAGATRTVISEDVASRVGITARTQLPIQFGDGRIELVDLGGPLLVELEGRSTVDEAFIVGDQVLIGQTVLEKLNLLVDCQQQRLIPHPRHPIPRI